MQRFFLLIIASSLLAMTLIPCSDIHANNTENVVSIGDAEDHHKEHQDICPPFCFCNCCSLNAEPTTLVKVINVLEIHRSQTFSFYRTDYIASYQFSVFQPPRLS